MFRRLCCLLCVLLVGVPAVAADKKADDAKKWDVEKPYGPTHEVDFTTDEGTWMNVDVSPDGRQIVFDLLGDIYIMPITGGEATLLRGGAAFEPAARCAPRSRPMASASPTCTASAPRRCSRSRTSTPARSTRSGTD